MLQCILLYYLTRFDKIQYSPKINNLIIFCCISSNIERIRMRYGEFVFLLGVQKCLYLFAL